MKKNLKFCLISIILLFFVMNGKLVCKARNIMLVFDLKDYKVEIKRAVEYFFNHELTPDDQVIVITPARKLYSFSKNTLQRSKKQIISQINDALRKHAMINASDYRTIYDQMKDIVRLIEDDQNLGYSTRINSYLKDYEANRKQLYSIRMVSQSMLLELSEIYKKTDENSDNQIYIFFEKVLRPIPSKDTMEKLRANYDVSFKAVEVFLEEKFKMKMELDKVLKEFKKANIKFNLIYINPKVHKHYKFQRVENSGDFYDAMSELVEETGGVKITTSQPKAIFENN
ncbi:MAG: hypothetical protein GTO17_10860 [Candidatus Aminicenantes bacterium]|nr:hypothetical protein [Candidatus Aminicenantes bacterium]